MQSKTLLSISLHNFFLDAERKIQETEYNLIHLATIVDGRDEIFVKIVTKVKEFNER